MGATIHFQGRLLDDRAFDRLVETVEAFARNRGWKAELIDARQVALKRMIGEASVDYEGPVRGIALQPHEWCEPVRFEFDDQLFLQEWTKTQFAPIETHIAIVDLLRRVAPLFQTFKVEDEGGYFETSNEDVLRAHIESIYRVIADLLLERPTRQSRVKLPSGRIADVVG